MTEKPGLQFFKKIQEKFPLGEVYLTGGAVRDSLLKRQNKDYDFIIRGIYQEDLEKFLSSIGETKLIGQAFGVYHYRPFNVEEKEFVEIALPRKEWGTGRGGTRDFRVEVDYSLPIREDLSRRDFTINALTLNLTTGEFIDEFQGVDDLRQGVVKAIGNPEKRFKESNIRVLRALRFATKLGFRIDRGTWSALKDFVPHLNKRDENGERITAVELIRDEVLKAFFADPVRALDLYEQSGALKLLLPEVVALHNVKQPPQFHPEGDVYIHTRRALKTLPHESPISLIMATLFHDIGKVETQQTPEHHGVDRIRFPGHEKIDAKQAEEAICQRLNFSNNLTKEIVWLVENHMQPRLVKEMKATEVEKLLFDHFSRNLIKLYKADILASDANLQDYHQAIREIQEMQGEKESKPPPPLINGHDLINLGFQPGPKIGKILEQIRNRQLEGELKNKEEARDFIKNTYLERSDG